MDKKPKGLIECLSAWQTGDYGDVDVPSPRARAIAELKTMGPQVVPALIERLRGWLREGRAQSASFAEVAQAEQAQVRFELN